ncbi:hypothetical protein IEZ26_14955 [Nocardioides cavernae]|uniref:Glycosyltransferase RgtA/B/C/D-like domain-containing protein n=1 Tax=Nocardioides cavernae TaxID=1921566 RepID=A0ABR8NCR9_9ACTN|nr:hypothetical protein [Nocardioides cavernae]MBD3925923.1 hypothetical protein [Nocardioides cavernae]MBM7513509.1 hypothetical protein [Nocardioides cavernae]
MMRALVRVSDELAHSRTWVLGTAVALMVVQLAFRTWAAASSWYFLDDLVFLRRHAEASDWSYLVDPYNGHVMPAAKAIYWLLRTTGPTEWWPGALVVVVGQALASAACLWMLVSLFGLRRAILVPYAIYLFLAMSVPSFMWFVAALQQLPLQITLSLGVGAWVRYLRTRRTLWLVACTGALGLGLAFWPKALFLLPLLAYLSIAYFSPLGVRRRLQGLRSQLVAFVPLLVVGLAYVGYYVSVVPGQLSTVTARLVGEFAETMLGTTLMTGLVGGPWRWRDPAPPNSFADPPQLAVHLAWVVVLLVVAYAWLRRLRTGRAFLLFLGYVGGTFVLVLAGRATALGATLGTDARYLSDIPLIAALCLGLAFIDLPDAPGSSAQRERPLVAAVPRPVGVGLLVVVLVGSVVSSIGYVRPWHRDNAAHAFFDTVRAEVESRGRTEMVDRVVPEDVMSQLAAPANSFQFLAPLVTDAIHFPDVSSDLAIVGDDGSFRQVVIDRGVDSVPGPLAGCGWKVTEKGRRIPLAGDAFDFVWWARIGYLSSNDSPVTVTAGQNRVQTSVRSGLNNLYLRLEGGFDHVTIDGLDPGTTLCVDTVEVGQPEPGAPLP